MDRKALLDHIEWLNADTSALNNDGVACYRYALKRVVEFIKSQPMEKEDAAQILNGWIEFVHDKDASPNDTPYSTEDVLAAMKMGADALLKAETK